jgi:hypothetical protein
LNLSDESEKIGKQKAADRTHEGRGRFFAIKEGDEEKDHSGEEQAAARDDKEPISCVFVHNVFNWAQYSERTQPSSRISLAKLDFHRPHPSTHNFQLVFGVFRPERKEEAI